MSDCARGNPIVGSGEFHPFDKTYLLAGLNFQKSREEKERIFELEVSIVPGVAISDGLWWAGAWGAVGKHYDRPVNNDDDPAGELNETASEGTETPADPDKTADGSRWAAGLSGGWRVLTVDFGVVHDESFRNPWGSRFRAGLAFSWEAFAWPNPWGRPPRYTTDCCESESWTTCECDHTPGGFSAFLYWAQERDHVLKHPVNMLGASLKLGAGFF
jgi:hypothetical protein